MQRVLAAACTRGAIFAIHEQGVAAARVSKIGRENPDVSATPILEGNDSYSALAVDPDGKLWLASRSGHVYTEAHLATAEPAARQLEARFETGRFSITALPGSAASGFADGASALWIAPDGTVFIGAFDGSVHVTDGSVWRRLALGTGKDVHAIAGLAAADVWLATAHQLFHYDGESVAQVPLLANEIEQHVTGIVPISAARAWVCTAQGHVLECARNSGTQALFMPRLIVGGDAGVIARALSHSWVGMGRFSSNVYLAGERAVHCFDGVRLGPAEELAITPKRALAAQDALVVVDKARRKDARLACLSGEPARWRWFRFGV